MTARFRILAPCALAVAVSLIAASVVAAHGRPVQPGPAASVDEAVVEATA